MPVADLPSVEKILGRSPDQLTLEERRALAGRWIALEIYTPKTLPVRVIQALGADVAECVDMLHRRGLDPYRFEYTPVKPPY